MFWVQQGGPWWDGLAEVEQSVLGCQLASRSDVRKNLRGGGVPGLLTVPVSSLSLHCASLLLLVPAELGPAPTFATWPHAIATNHGTKHGRDHATLTRLHPIPKYRGRRSENKSPSIGRNSRDNRRCSKMEEKNLNNPTVQGEAPQGGVQKPEIRLLY